jgi:hypothetical protein
MDREDAIEYLEGKDKIEGAIKYSKEEEKEIEKVMKHGKVYGDPLVCLD